MLALWSMAGKEFKEGINNATLFCNSSTMTFFMCMDLYDPNKHLIEPVNCRKCDFTSYVRFGLTKPFLK